MTGIPRMEWGTGAAGTRPTVRLHQRGPETDFDVPGVGSHPPLDATGG